VEIRREPTPGQGYCGIFIYLIYSIQYSHHGTKPFNKYETQSVNFLWLHFFSLHIVLKEQSLTAAFQVAYCLVFKMAGLHFRTLKHTKLLSSS
jgi:hypothetical protein